MNLLRSSALIGATLLVTGVALFLWENVGTNIQDAPEQAEEIHQVTQAIAARRPTPAGGAFAILTIPAIGLTAPIVQGTTDTSLARGVGHYRETPMPGQTGNVGLAGHRTTHGKPFWDLQKLRPGDVITVQTPTATIQYSVTGSQVVSPSNISVLRQLPDGLHELTLTTCEPRFTALSRLIVHAVQTRLSAVR